MEQSDDLIVHINTLELTLAMSIKIFDGQVIFFKSGFLDIVSIPEMNTTSNLNLSLAIEIMTIFISRSNIEKSCSSNDHGLSTSLNCFKDHKSI